MANGTCNIPEPKSLKDILDLLGWLDKAEHKNHVFNKIEEKTSEFLKTDYIPESTIEKNLQSVIDNVVKFRENLLKDKDNFGIYSGHTFSTNCTDNCANLLLKYLPTLHSELWFLLFQTGTEFSRRGGYGWSTDKFGSKHPTSNLHKWLVSNADGVSVIPKGFDNNVLKEEGLAAHIAPWTGIGLYQGNPLNYAQYGLFLIDGREFQPANLASFTLFLEEFCRKVNEDEAFRKRVSDYAFIGTNIKTVCEKLLEEIKALTGEKILALYDKKSLYEDDGVDAEHVKSLNLDKKIKNNMYEGKLKVEAVPTYVDWLMKNLKDVMKAFKLLQKDYWQWDKETFDSRESPGPFKYGFIFKDGRWQDSIGWELKNHVLKLTDSTDPGSLLSLLRCFEKDAKPVPNLPVPPKGDAHPAGPAGPEELPKLPAGQKVVVPPASPSKGVDPLSPLAPAGVTGKGEGHLVGTRVEGVKESLASDISIMPIVLLLWFFISKIF
ncbi:hypothetical protein BgAZ_207650 [Babesia gibsoni]|uniref:Uncharacterized protein n=1 Tax=Babesia gibsoni TaxID=33632 RepID=A0AAD8PEP0_BABGI|nr:hypothetical protein BgAZ_207650 [Babesia gibsoni]